MSKKVVVSVLLGVLLAACGRENQSTPICQTIAAGARSKVALQPCGTEAGKPEGTRGETGIVDPTPLDKQTNPFDPDTQAEKFAAWNKDHELKLKKQAWLKEALQKSPQTESKRPKR